MPNWCKTTYKCVGDKDDLKALKETIDGIRQKTLLIPHNGIGLWIRDIVDHLGYDYKQYRCKGEIIDYYLDEKGLTICQSTAWSEQEGIREIIEKEFPSLKVYYREEELIDEVYNTNDSEGIYFPERYSLDGAGGTNKLFKSIEYAAEYVASIIGSKPEPSVDGIKSALDNYLEALDDKNIWYVFHEFKIVK